MPAFKDLTGARVGKYSVIRLDHWDDQHGRRRAIWLFRCECGEEFISQSDHVRRGVRSCKRCRFEHKRLDITGKVFGLLRATDYAGTKQKTGGQESMWRAECTRCSKSFVRSLQALQNITRCPCNRPRTTHGHVTGGMSRTYVSWNAMLNRCTHKSAPNYQRYGGRGIQVCDRWRASFENFLADMGERPSGASIDRIDGNGHYEPTNCRWATKKQQRRNMSENTIITFKGVSKPLADWADELGINRQTLRFRYVRKGWSAERSLTEPVGTNVGRRKP